ncbi:MAG: hypothetical protein ACLUZZ_05435 [Alistipes inops]
MSSKDSVLMEYVVGLLCGLAPGIRVERYVPEKRYDAAIATGSDNTGGISMPCSTAYRPS